MLMAVVEGLAMLGRREEAAKLYPLTLEAIGTGAVTTLLGSLPYAAAGIAGACGGRGGGPGGAAEGARHARRPAPSGCRSPWRWRKRGCGKRRSRDDLKRYGPPAPAAGAIIHRAG